MLINFPSIYVIIFFIKVKQVLIHLLPSLSGRSQAVVHWVQMVLLTCVSWACVSVSCDLTSFCLAGGLQLTLLYSQPPGLWMGRRGKRRTRQEKGMERGQLTVWLPLLGGTAGRANALCKVGSFHSISAERPRPLCLTKGNPYGGGSRPCPQHPGPRLEIPGRACTGDGVQHASITTK